jgi:hypothetical protein
LVIKKKTTPQECSNSEKNIKITNFKNMGCDIHMWAEIKKPQTNKWEKAGEVFENKYYNPEFPISKFNQPKTEHPYDSRNYDLFAILANVKNGYGFARTDTGDGFVPISFPKGIPQDATLDYISFVDKWRGDGHSHSYFTIDEILDYNWTKKTQKRGWVNYVEYMNFKEKGEPNNWCSEIRGPEIKKVSNDEMFELIQRNLINNNYFTYIQWEVEYWENCKEFLETVRDLPKVLNTTPENIRLVFFFDN